MKEVLKEMEYHKVMFYACKESYMTIIGHVRMQSKVCFLTESLRETATKPDSSGHIALPMIDTGDLHIGEINFFLGNCESLSKLWLSPELISIVIHYVLMGVRACVLCVYVSRYLYFYLYDVIVMIVTLTGLRNGMETNPWTCL